MDKINEIIEWFKNINMNTIIDILIAILIFLLFKLFSGTLSYVVSKLFKIKEKNKSKLKQNALYRTLNIFFPLLGAYLGLRFLNLPQDITALITKVFRILVIITISIGLANCITPKSPLFKQINFKLSGRKDETFVNFIVKILRGLIYIITAFIIVSELGYDLNGLLAGLGLSGVVVTLAAQDAAKNIFGGIVILWDKPFKIGDWIETTKFEGTVEDITFRSTRIRTFENSIVTIPNSTITNDALINWSKMKKRRYKENFELELSTPLKKVCDIENEIIKMLEEHPRILNDNIMVRFDKVTENGYNLLVYVYTDALNLADYLATSENINFKIMDILNKQRVELAYPSKTIYLKK